MLPESIQLVIVRPERQLLRQTVVEVTLPGGDACLGILPGHAPLITELGIGELTYSAKGAGQAEHLAISSGFAEGSGDQMTWVPGTGGLSAGIDVPRVDDGTQLS